MSLTARIDNYDYTDILSPGSKKKQLAPPLLLFEATPSAYGGSQAMGQIRATAASLRHSHSHSGSELHLQPVTYTTDQGNARSLTH